MSANSAAFDHVNGFRWRQGDPSLAESEARLYDLGVLRSVLEESVEIAVADARADGVTWAKIGDALGVTHQAVIKRYGRAVVADGRRRTQPQHRSRRPDPARRAWPGTRRRRAARRRDDGPQPCFAL